MGGREGGADRHLTDRPIERHPTPSKARGGGECVLAIDGAPPLTSTDDRLSVVCCLALPASLPLCLPAYLTCLPIRFHAALPVCLPTYIYASLSTYMSAYLSVCFPAYIPTCLLSWESLGRAREEGKKVQRS